MSTILAMAAALTSGVPVLATFSDTEARQTGLVAERIERPRGTDGARFAARLVDEAGLKPWNGIDRYADPVVFAGIASIARHAADGREVAVYYDTRTLPETSGPVCRVRRPRGGLTDVHYRAVTWCFATFGVALPAVRQPAIFATSAPQSSDSFIGDTLGVQTHKAASVDLNGDGVAEVIVFANDPRRCGSGGCQLFILTPQARGYRVVTKVSVARLPVRVLATRTHGWSDIGVQVGGGGIRRGYEARLRFDGKGYPGNPTIAPAVAAGKVGGRIVLR